MVGSEPSDRGQHFDVKAGLPFRRRVRVTNGTTLWASLDLFEARMQIRVEPDLTSRLKYDFTPHLVTAIDGDDILVNWNLSGEDTLELKGGYYDLILSDMGNEDDTAIPVLWGTITVTPIVTSLDGV